MVTAHLTPLQETSLMLCIGDKAEQSVRWQPRRNGGSEAECHLRFMTFEALQAIIFILTGF